MDHFDAKELYNLWTISVLLPYFSKLLPLEKFLIHEMGPKHNDK